MGRTPFLLNVTLWHYIIIMLIWWNYMIYEVSVFWYYWSSQHCITFYYPRKYILSWDICIFIVSLTWAVVFVFEWYLSGASIWGLKHQFHLASFLGKISNQWQCLLYCWGLLELMCDRKISKMWSYAEYPSPAQILPVHLNWQLSPSAYSWQNLLFAVNY